MSKFSRIVVLVTALASLFAVMSPTAGAVTWTNSGGTTFHATGGAGTLSIGANRIACPTSTATGTAPMSSTTSTIATGTIVFSGCSLVGQSTFIHCSYTLTGLSSSGTVTTGAADVTCDQRLTANPTNSLCHISGATPITYTNPSGSTVGKVTLLASSSLVVSNGNVACSLGTGNAQLSEQTLSMTSVAQSPIWTRDA